VTALQKALISLGYLKGSADGKFGAQTRQAVIDFQKANRLTADGLAGKKTLTLLENGKGNSSGSGSSSGSSSSASSGSSQSGGTPSSGKTASGPSGGSVRLLHWFDNIKPNLRNGQTLYIYEPSSGQGWNLRIYSCGRHCDAEPRTAEDTASMLKAFGGTNTWSQKAVYVKLPDGTWTIGSTHDKPHDSGSI
jgi:peptidoglycan hydrolase-like protein with peptidoglycan-binding domain